MMVATTETVSEGLGDLVQDLVVYFYSDNGLIMSTQPERFQRAFDALTDLFDQVGLWTNTQKMVSMAC